MKGFEKMKLIVGLGNIGPRYEKTRHNTGFMVVDRFAKEHGLSFDKEKFEAQLAQGFVAGEKVLVAKPTTYMNESGRAVRKLMDFYDIDLKDVIIAYDDMDLACGRLRLRQRGSAGGHNGIKSLIAHLGTQNFNRLRVGIDHPKQMKVVDWVLGRFTPEQTGALEPGLKEATAALDHWLKTADFAQTMNEYNRSK